MGTRSSFRRVPSQHVHEQMTKLRAELGVLKVKLELRGNTGTTYVGHVNAADKIAGELQNEILPPFEPASRAAVETDRDVSLGGQVMHG